MPKIIDLPKPKDEFGNEISPEEVEKIGNEPTYVPVEYARNGKKVILTIACDFDQVEREGEKHYQAFKTEQFRAFAGYSPKSQKRVNSKFTNIRKEQEPEEESDGMEQIEKSNQLDEKLPVVFAELMFGGKEPIIIGGNVPGMPGFDDQLILKEWFAQGSVTARLVMDSIIAKYDPTSPLALFKQVMKQHLESAAAPSGAENTLNESEVSGILSETLPVENPQPDSAGMESQEAAPVLELT